MASIMEFSCLGRSCKGAKLETDAVRSQTLAKRNKQVQSENLAEGLPNSLRLFVANRWGWS